MPLSRKPPITKGYKVLIVIHDAHRRMSVGGSEILRSFPTKAEAEHYIALMKLGPDLAIAGQAVVKALRGVGGEG